MSYIQSIIHILHDELIQEIFLWIPLEEFGVIPQVCQYWNLRGTSDQVWKVFYLSLNH
jgi:hypothetical protein